MENVSFREILFLLKMSRDLLFAAAIIIIIKIIIIIIIIMGYHLYHEAL
jgi:hypothetical protein